MGYATTSLTTGTPTPESASTQPTTVPAPSGAESISISQKTQDGYSYELEYSVWDPVPSKEGGIYTHPGSYSFTCPTFDPEKDIAIPVRVLITNTTEKFSLENLDFLMEM